MRAVKVVVESDDPKKKATCGLCSVLSDAVVISLTQVGAVGTVLVADGASEDMSTRLGARDNGYLDLLAKLVVDRFRGATKKRIVLTLALQPGRERELRDLELVAEALKRRAFLSR
mmetsp:Transcript_22257/g.68513  ORF Transcript_22257/g.68513 Transcript_22257/m.68513 type:complete len:116 (+) Transcript_22257:54-401(+)